MRDARGVPGGSFSIFIPAYNAARHLGALVARIPPEARDSARTIWIIDDGSTDDTAAVIERLARSCSMITPVSFPENRGYGAAVKEGLGRVRSEGVDAAVCLHADGQYAPEEIPRLLRALRERKLDLLQGSRLASGTALSGGMPLYKFVSGLFLTTLENVVFRMKLSDYHSGYMVYGRRAIDELPFGRLSDGFDFDLEVIASARARGFAIGEAPVPTHYGDEVSHLNPVTYGLRVFRVMFRYATGRYARLGRARGT